MWWRPLTPRSSTETKCVHRKMYVIARRPAADVAPSGDSLRSQSVLFKMSEILTFSGNADCEPSCGMVRNDLRYLGTFCWNQRNKKPACRLPRYAGILICGASEPRQSLPRPDPSGIRRESRPTGGQYLRWRGWCRPWQPEPGRPSLPCRPQNER